MQQQRQLQTGLGKSVKDCKKKATTMPTPKSSKKKNEPASKETAFAKNNGTNANKNTASNILGNPD